MTEVLADRPSEVERDPAASAWIAYLAAHAAAVPVTDPVEMDALRREYAYLPRRRWWQ